MEPQALHDSLTHESGPEDSDKEKIKTRLAHFILSLIQAFLRTGYYTPDHPEAKKAKTGLYEDFHSLFVQKDELTFIVREDRQGKNILIEGVLPETQSLDRLMMRGMAAMYIPRFVDFLERKDLVSLTLKQTMTREEFTRFIDVMSEPTFVDTRRTSDKERFSETLKERGIFHISYLFNEELLAGRRKIPWRAQLTLSRLKKDLRMIPLYLDLGREELRRVRQEIIRDVTRPIRCGETLYYILTNSDLAKTKELTESEIDNALIASLSDDLLLKTSQSFLKEIRRHEETESPPGKVRQLARQIASTLNQRGVHGREAVLEAYFKLNLVPLEHLPEGVQRKIKLDRLVNKFLTYSTAFFDQFDRVEDKEKYLHLARSFTQLIPELIRRDRYEEILKIIDHIDRHFNEKKHLSIYAGQVLEEIGRGEVSEALKEKFLREKKEVRLAIAPIFLKLHVGSVPFLLSILKESDDQWVRKHACELLVEIGSSAINFILQELNKGEMPIGATTDVIRVLGDIKGDKWIRSVLNTLQVYLTHKDARLREEALGAYYKLRGQNGESRYLELLDDPAPGVKRKAIQCLARIRSETGLTRFLEMLRQFEEEGGTGGDQVESRLFAALGSYGNIEVPGAGLLEDFLLDTLDRRFDSGTFAFLRKRKNPLGEETVAAICESLAAIGTRKSLPTLKKLEKHSGNLRVNKAREALKRITEKSRAPD